jgi:hypothetical protein
VSDLPPPGGEPEPPASSADSPEPVPAAETAPAAQPEPASEPQPESASASEARPEPEPEAAPAEVAPAEVAAEPPSNAATATATTATATGRMQRRNGTGRKIAVAILIVLSTIFVCTASVALWAQRTVFDSDAIVDATDSALDQPEVTTAISNYLTDQIVQVTSQAQILEKVLPSSLDPLAPFIRGALTSRVQEQVNDFVDSQPGRNLINNAVRAAHKSAVRLLQGDGLLSDSAFSVQNGKVNLDLTQVIASVLTGLQERGVIPSSIDLSSIGTGAHQEQVQKIADRFGVTLPENFGQITVLDSARIDNASDTLATAQRAVVIVKRGVVLWTVLAFVLVIVTFLVTRTRRRTAVQLGLAIAALAIILRVVVRRIPKALDRVIEKPGATAAAKSFVSTLTRSLSQSLGALLVIGLVVALLAFLARPRAGGEDRWLRSTVAAHADGARVAVVAAVLALLWWLGWRWVTVVGAVLLIVAGLLAVRAIERSAADGPQPETSETPPPPTSAPTAA